MPNLDKCGGAGGCLGATVDLAFDYAIEHGGIVQEYQMGYTSYYGDDGKCTIETDDEPKKNSFLRGTVDAKGPDPGGISGGVANIEVRERGTPVLGQAQI